MALHFKHFISKIALHCHSLDGDTNKSNTARFELYEYIIVLFHFGLVRITKISIYYFILMSKHSCMTVL